MEVCKGGELFDAVTRRKRYSEADAARVIRSVTSAVSYMHSKGFVHRDLKPENVVLLGNESDTVVRVIDFGQAAKFQPGNIFDFHSFFIPSPLAFIYLEAPSIE